MPRRHLLFATNEVYHIFNRSVGREDIFSGKSNPARALEILDYYRYPQTLRYSKFKTLSLKQKQVYLEHYTSLPQIIEIFSFALMPNHFHLLVRQLQEGGIKQYVSQVQNSFAKYFNTKSERHGAVFQSQFKAVRLESNDQFAHVVRYIHLNPVTSYMIPLSKLATYPWTSHTMYLNQKKNRVINSKWLLGKFSNLERYKLFINNQADYQQKLKQIKRLCFD